MSATTPRPGTQRRPATPRQRPDPNPLRLAAGFAGIASATAMLSAMLAPAPVAQTVQIVTAAAPEPAVVHVTRYVTLAPGQTAPPQAVVQQQAAPSPRTVIVTTRQSGTRP
jgi:hypothetical protein